MTEIVFLGQTGAVILAGWAIVFGIGAWRREFIGKRQIELAEQVLTKFFELKDSIAIIRSPFSSVQEGSSRKRNTNELRETSELLDRAYILFERYSTKESVFVDFNTLKYRFMASFGAGAEQIFADTIMVLNSIFVSAQMIGTHYCQRECQMQMEQDEGNHHLEQMQRYQRIFWDQGTEDDEIRTKLADIQQRLDMIVEPCFKKPMRSYTWLTRPLKLTVSIPASETDLPSRRLVVLLSNIKSNAERFC